MGQRELERFAGAAVIVTGGAHGIGRACAAWLAEEGVHINIVAPATIRTRNWQGQEGGADRFRHLYPLARVGEPEDVAAAIAFLASSDAAWIIGHTLPVDGGLMTGARPEFQGDWLP